MAYQSDWEIGLVAAARQAQHTISCCHPVSHNVTCQFSSRRACLNSHISMCAPTLKTRRSLEAHIATRPPSAKTGAVAVESDVTRVLVFASTHRATAPLAGMKI